MVICEMQTMPQTTVTGTAAYADGGTKFTGLIWGLGYAPRASFCYPAAFFFSAIGNSVTLG